MAKLFTSLTVLSALFIASSNALDWCAITCKDPYTGKMFKHTMCNPFSTFKPNRPARRCNRVVKQGLDQSEIDLIVNYHNKIRRSVANLPPLVWDETLAMVAQRWANQCDYSHHDKCRNLGDTEDESAGQNMGYYWNTDGQVDLQQEIMAGWVKESRFVDGNMIASFPEQFTSIGHYTQMVWAKTTKIGCGFMKFPETKVIDNQLWDGYSSFLVCNYNPSGNVLGAPVY